MRFVISLGRCSTRAKHFERSAHTLRWTLPEIQPFRFAEATSEKGQGHEQSEYRSAAKGESWKFRLMNTIDQCMRYASTREEYISLMESEGYQVRWTAGRKNITYTTPTGMKCRDDRLHDGKYTKEVMEYEFRNPGSALPMEELKRRNAPQPIPNQICPSKEEWQKLLHRLDELERHTAAHTALLRGGFQPEEAVPRPGADGGTDAGCDGDTGATATGWEKERDLYLSAQFENSDVGRGMAGSDPAGHHGGYGGLAGDLVRLGRSGA